MPTRSRAVEQGEHFTAGIALIPWRLDVSRARRVSGPRGEFDERLGREIGRGEGDTETTGS